MKHLQNILDGMAGALESWGSSRSYQTSSGGFSADRRHLSADARRVGNDIRITTQGAYGKSSKETAGQKR